MHLPIFRLNSYRSDIVWVPYMQVCATVFRGLRTWAQHYTNDPLATPINMRDDGFEPGTTNEQVIDFWVPKECFLYFTNHQTENSKKFYTI